MKAAKKLIVLYLCLLLLLSVPAGIIGSNPISPIYRDRRVVVTVQVTGAGSAPVEGALVSVYEDGQQLGSGRTDVRGIAQMGINVSSGSVDLRVEASKSGMETKVEIMRLGRNAPTRLPLWSISLGESSLTAGTNNVLPVLVVDENGHPVNLAHVNLYFGTFSGFSVRPAERQQDTNSRGIAVLDFPANDKTSTFTLEVSREDKKTEIRVLNKRSSSNLLPEERFVLQPRPESASDLFPTTSITVNVIDAEAETPLEGALVRLSSSALTNSQRNRPHEGVTGPDGSATVAIELMSADSSESIGITVSKAGYASSQQTMSVKQRDAKGKTMIYPDSIKLKKGGSTASTEVKVRVLDDASSRGISDADITLDGAGYATGSTNPSGEATIAVNKPGEYDVRVSQEYYWPVKDAKVRVVAGVEPGVVEFRLKAKPTKDAAQDSIEVTVLAKESIDDKDPRPLKLAAISDGRVMTYTDENGRATIYGAYDGPQQITVTASDHKPVTKRVPVYKPLIGNSSGKATFVLEPEVSESSPIRLVVEVLDAAPPHEKLSGAYAYLWLGDIQVATERAPAGEATFVLKGTADLPLDRLRSGVKLVAKAPEYDLGESMITDLKPSLDSSRATIFLKRDWSALKKQIDTLEAKVFAWKNDIGASQRADMKPFIDKALIARRDAKDVEKEITSGGFVVLGTVSFCDQARTLTANLQSYESQASAKEQALAQKINAATALTKTCSTERDAERVRSNYRDAITILAEIGSLNKKAQADSDALKDLARQITDAWNSITEKKNKIAQLTQLHNTATQNAAAAAAANSAAAQLSKTLVSRQITLRAEFAVLSVKANGLPGLPADLRKRIDAIDGILGGTSNIYSFGSQPGQDLPASVRDAAAEIDALRNNAVRSVADAERRLCRPETALARNELVDRIFTNSTFEIGLAADLPGQVDKCAAGAGKSTSSKQDPKVEEIPDEEIVVTGSTLPGLTTGTLGAPVRPRTKPEVEEIPDDRVASTDRPKTGSRTRPERVEEIPDDRTTDPPASTRDRSGPTRQPTPKPQKTPKPQDPNGGFWGNLGRAVGEAIRAQNNQPPASGGGGAPTTVDPNQIYAFVLDHGIGLVLATQQTVNSRGYCQWRGGGTAPCPQPAQIIGVLGGPYATEQDGINDLKTKLDCQSGYWGLFIPFGGGNGRAWLQNNVGTNGCRTVKQL